AMFGIPCQDQVRVADQGQGAKENALWLRSITDQGDTFSVGVRFFDRHARPLLPEVVHQAIVPDLAGEARETPRSLRVFPVFDDRKSRALDLTNEVLELPDAVG